MAADMATLRGEDAPRLASGQPLNGARLLRLLSLPFALIAGGLLSLLQGQDRNGDLLIAHATWIWTLLHQQQDLAWSPGGPAQLVPSLWNVPWYYTALHWPPQVAIFYLGMLGGLAIWLSAAVAWTALSPAGRLRLPLVLICVAGTYFGPVMRTEFGTTFGNLPTGILVLGAVLCYLRRTQELTVARGAAIGLLLGGAVGLKLTNLVWVLAMAPAMAATGVHIWRRRAVWVGWCAGISVGYLATGGYWAWMMWDRFRNPLYPFYNGLFHSSYGWTESVRDDRYTVGWAKALRMPLDMAVGKYPSELAGRDVRWAILAELVLVAAVIVHLRRRGREGWARLVEPASARFLFVFAGFGWVIWLAEFGIARYLLVLESLSTLILLALTDLIVRRPSPAFVATATLTCTVALLVSAPTFLKSDWRDTWFDFNTPPLAQQAHLLVVVPASLAVTHGVIGMPNDVVAVRGAPIYDLKLGRIHPPGYTARADEEVARAIETHQGPIVSAAGGDRVSMQAATKSASRYGFQLDRSSCQEMSSIAGRWLICAWTKEQ